MTNEDFNKLDWRQDNYLSDICDEFCELPKEEQRAGVHYGDYFIIEV